MPDGSISLRQSGCESVSMILRKAESLSTASLLSVCASVSGTKSRGETAAKMGGEEHHYGETQVAFLLLLLLTF